MNVGRQGSNDWLIVRTGLPGLRFYASLRVWRWRWRLKVRR